MRMYPDEYTTQIDWTCEDCDITHEDVEVTVADDVAVVTCPQCNYEKWIEMGDWDD